MIMPPRRLREERRYAQMLLSAFIFDTLLFAHAMPSVFDVYAMLAVYFAAIRRVTLPRHDALPPARAPRGRDDASYAPLPCDLCYVY